jgi:hypothetical protein
MRITTTIVQSLIRAAGIIQLALGALFWTYNALNLIPMHMLVGLVLVLSLWVLAGIAARSGVNLAVVGVAFVWGAVVPLLGIAQTQILPGSAHWVVQVLHLLVGLTALALAEVLGRAIRTRRLPRPTTTTALAA